MLNQQTIDQMRRDNFVTGIACEGLFYWNWEQIEYGIPFSKEVAVLVANHLNEWVEDDFEDTTWKHEMAQALMAHQIDHVEQLMWYVDDIKVVAV